MRISLILVIAGASFLALDQGVDTLRYFAEYQSFKGRLTGQTVTFLGAAFLWVFGSWYWARVMSYIAFKPAPTPSPGVRRIQTWAPRLAGFLAITGLAIAFYRAGLSYEDHSKGPGGILRAYFAISVVGAVVYIAFVLTRRRLVAPWLSEQMRRNRAMASMGRALSRVRPAAEERFNSAHISRLPRGTWIWLSIPGVVAFVFFVLFALWPATTAPHLGTVGILLMAAAGWIAFGSALDMFGMHTRFPVFISLLLLALLFSIFNDNHAVRTLDQPVATSWRDRDSVAMALRDWMKHQLAAPTARRDTKIPLFLVAAEGGGIRAAYWSARVLTTIQDSNPRFADQLFALSGVSGGSLGSAVFAALIADQRSVTANGICRGRFNSIRDCSQEILGSDFLAPAVAGTLYPDLLQRFLPVGVARFDRARALETAWEHVWRENTGTNRFAEPFDGLWDPTGNRWQPHLLLNATWVETGKRLITSDLRVLPRDDADPVEFADVEDTNRFYDTRALPLSAAVHLSARFTYVSPAASLERDGKIYGRAVDGGYFENSGTTAVLEILKTIDQMSDSDPQWKRVVPYVILISNEPGDPDETEIRLTNARENKRIKPLPAGNELVSPWLTLLRTREARGNYATVTTEWHLGSAQFLHFGLCQDSNLRIPLGWVLSRAARQIMDSQLDDDVCRGRFRNRTNLETISKAIHHRTARR